MHRLHAKRLADMPKTAGQFLDAIKRSQEFGSDYALAKHLGVRQTVISNYRKGRSLPDEVMAVRIARELGLEAGYVLACIAAERTNDSGLKETWKDIAAKLGISSTAALLLAFGLSGADPAALDAAQFTATHGIHYTKLMPIALTLWGFWQLLRRVRVR